MNSVEPTASDKRRGPPEVGSADARQATHSPHDVFEIRDEEIDVDRIMEDIQRSVARKREEGLYGDEPWLLQRLDFSQPGGGARSLSDRLGMLKMAARLDLEGEPITSHRRFTGKVIVWMKHWTRFWIRRYTDSIFYRQNHFNAETVAALTELSEQVAGLRASIERIEKKLDEWKNDG